METGVYQILNLNNMKSYVGSSASSRGLEYRKTEHFRTLRQKTHRNIHLQRAYNKHGEESFLLFPLEFCLPEKCIEREQFWMDLLQPEYNISPTAGSTLGRKFTNKTKIKMQKSANKRWADPEERRKTSESVIVAMSNPIVKKKMIDGSKKRWADPEERRKTSEATESKLTSDEVIEIRRLWKELSPRRGLQAQLARIFNVCSASIGNVVNRITWKHLPEE